MTGGYDIVANVVGDDVNAIGRPVLNPSRGVTSFKITTTLIVVA